MTDRDASAISQTGPSDAPGVAAAQTAGAERSDADLVAAARTDALAFDALYRRYVARIYRFARARLDSEQDAEDVTTATFMEAYTSLGGYREQGQFGAWLFTIARRQVLALRRRTRAHGDIDAVDLMVPATDLPAHRDVLRRALLRLSEDRRDVLLLRFYGDLKVAEIAAVLGKGESAVKMLLHRGLAQLHQLLREDPRG